MKKINIKLLSLLLSLIMIFSFTNPTIAITNSVPEEHVQPQSTYTSPEGVKLPKDPEQLQSELDSLTYEVESMRNENTKHIRLPDGSYQMVIYGETVHNLNSEGEWEEIDNSLSTVNGLLSTKDSRVKFAKHITGNENLYTLHKDNYKVTVGLSGAHKKTEAVVTNPDTSEEGMTKLQGLTNIEGLTATVLYADALEGVDLEYVISSNNIKENIIVKEADESYIYTFTLELNNLDAALANGSIILSDSKSGEAVYTIPAPYMYDAEGVTSYSAGYSLESHGNGKYTFTLTADPKWINADGRAFPVTIDPSLVSIAQTEDAYINSNAPYRNYGSYVNLCVDTYAEAYYKFATPNLPSNLNIISASAKIPYFYFAVDGNTTSIGVYKVNSSWGELSINWNNKPSTGATALSSTTLYDEDESTEEDPQYAYFTVTDYVKSWYTGTANHGFAFKYSSGNGSTLRFIAHEKMSKSSQLVINYTDAYLSEGVYSLQKNGTSIYAKTSLPTSGSTWIVQDTGHSVHPSVSIDNLENLFKFTYRPQHNDYVIRSMLDNAFLMSPSISDNAPILSKNTTSDASLSTSYTWKVETAGSAQNFYITYTSGSTKYYLRSNTSSHDSKLMLTTSQNDTGTVWKLTPYIGNAYEDVSLEGASGNIYVGDSLDLDARVQSTVIGYYGPVTYSVENITSSSDPLASINSSSGYMVTYIPGQVSVAVTFQGSRWVWSWNLTIYCLPLSGSEIVFDEACKQSWNDNGTVQLNSNCYNYALNIKYNIGSDNNFNFMKPGILSNRDRYVYIPTNNTHMGNPLYYRVIADNSVIGANAAADAAILGRNFFEIEKNQPCPAGMYKIALVIDSIYDPNDDSDPVTTVLNGQTIAYVKTDTDFHWYRQNADGTWSHKRGGSEVTIVDAYGKTIYAPNMCSTNYGNGNYYNSEVTYYAITRNN